MKHQSKTENILSQYFEKTHEYSKEYSRPAAPDRRLRPRGRRSLLARSPGPNSRPHAPTPDHPLREGRIGQAGRAGPASVSAAAAAPACDAAAVSRSACAFASSAASTAPDLNISPTAVERVDRPAASACALPRPNGGGAHAMA